MRRAHSQPEYKGRTGLHDEGYPGHMLEGTSSRGPGQYGHPGTFSERRDRAAQVEALQNSGVATYDIPAFLRKQAD